VTSSVHQVTVASALKQHNGRLTALERSDGSNRWVTVNPEGGPDTDPEGPEFQNGWFSVGAPYPPVQFKRFLNWVHLRGAFSGGSDNTVMFTLPPAYCPIAVETLMLPYTDGSDFATVSVSPSGDVTYLTNF
jgi:hypothetical protein